MTEGYRQIQHTEREGWRGRNEEKEGGRRMGRGKEERECGEREGREK